MIQSTATLRVGDKCIDTASWKDYPAMVALGVKCVGRYISTSGLFTPVYTWKSLTPAEVTALHAHGIGVVAFWEASGPDPLQGESKGIGHGTQAAKSLTALGYPAGLPCIAAVDFDATPANINAVAAYISGFNNGLGSKWVTGVYGDVDIIKRCAADGTASIFHYAGASSWSHGEFSTLIHLRQRISGSTPNYDDNAVLRELDMWLPHDVPDETPIAPAPIEEDDMPAARVIRIKGYANAYLHGPGGISYLTGELYASYTTGDDPLPVVEVDATPLAMRLWGIDSDDLKA